MNSSRMRPISAISSMLSALCHEAEAEARAQDDPARDVAEDEGLADEPGNVRRQRGEHDAERDVAEKGYFVRQGAGRKPKTRIWTLAASSLHGRRYVSSKARLGSARPPGARRRTTGRSR